MIINHYLYYVLKFTIQEQIYNSQTGAGQPHVYSSDVQNLKIHIPSKERQKEIVEYCEYNDALIMQLEQEMKQNKKQAEDFMVHIATVE